MVSIESPETQISWRRKARVHAAAFIHQATRSTLEGVNTLIDVIKERPQLSSLTDQEGREIAQGFLVKGIFYITESEGGFVMPRQTDTVRPLSPTNKS